MHWKLRAIFQIASWQKAPSGLLSSFTCFGDKLKTVGDTHMSVTGFLFSYGAYNTPTLLCVTVLFTFYLTMNLTKSSSSQICIDFCLPRVNSSDAKDCSVLFSGKISSFPMFQPANKTDLILYVTTWPQNAVLVSPFLISLIFIQLEIHSMSAIEQTDTRK